ncbi:MAG: methyltransferase domain-containing protein [Thermodesulfobacteriota bacterium]
MKLLSTLLAHPLTRGLNIDDAQSTLLRRRIIKEKAFLHKIYLEWYDWIVQSLPAGDEPVLELGSGGGFLSELAPDVIASDVFYLPNVSIVLDAHCLPFKRNSLRAIAMVDVLHHLSRSPQFFCEAMRCVRREGRIVMIEPWVTPWSTWVYTNFHHEPFDPNTPDWEFNSTGPLSGANEALPWILFYRDRNRFQEQFPGWRIQNLEVFMPFRYVLAGGVSLRSFVPGPAFRPLTFIEKLLNRWMHLLGMFCQIVLVKSA